MYLIGNVEREVKNAACRQPLAEEAQAERLDRIAICVLGACEEVIDSTRVESMRTGEDRQGTLGGRGRRGDDTTGGLNERHYLRRCNRGREHQAFRPTGRHVLTQGDLGAVGADLAYRCSSGDARSADIVAHCQPTRARKGDHG